MDIVLVIEQNNHNGFKKNIDKLTKQAIPLSSMVSEWPTHFADAFRKCRIQKDIVKIIEREIN